MIEQQLAGAGQHAALPLAFEQRRPELFLELLDDPTDRRGRNPQDQGRAADRSKPRDQLEIMDAWSDESQPVWIRRPVRIDPRSGRSFISPTVTLSRDFRSHQ